jgi:hypothetical protein
MSFPHDRRKFFAKWRIPLSENPVNGGRHNPLGSVQLIFSTSGNIDVDIDTDEVNSVGNLVGVEILTD